MHTYQNILSDRSILDNYKSTEPVPLTCEHCTKLYYKKKKNVLDALKIGSVHNYCNIQCKGLSTVVKHTVTCLQCEKVFEKSNSEVKKGSRHFCCRSCAAVYNNARKVRTPKTPTKRKPKIKKCKPIRENTWFLTKATSKICKRILNITDDEYIITEDDYEQVRNIIRDHIHTDNITPREINEKYSIGYRSDFGSYIKKCLKIELKTLKDSIINLHMSRGTRRSDITKLYRAEASFIFNPYRYKNIPGYDLLVKFGVYHKTKNPDGVCRDHMLSVVDGRLNNIDPFILSHPANCQFLTCLDNLMKSGSSLLTLEQLLLRIKQWDNNENLEMKQIENGTRTPFVRPPMSDDTKAKLSTFMSRYYNITDGTRNMKLVKGEEIPNGFRRGLTKRQK